MIDEETHLSQQKQLSEYFPIAVVAYSLFATAFLVRAFFAFQWQDMPYGTAPLLDARAYDDWAMALATGQPTGDHAFYQSPLYPYLLSVLYHFAGHSYVAVSLLNAALDSGTVVMLALIAFSLFGYRAALITGLLAAAYAPMIFYTAPPMKEPLALFLLSLFLFLALRALRGSRGKDYALCGLIFGLAALTRGNVVLLAPVVPLFALMRYRLAALRGILLFALAFLIALAPATWHNYRTSHDFVPLTYADGFNLYIGHSPYANGTNAYPPEVSTDPEQERLNSSRIAEQSAGRKLSPSEISAYWRTRAFDFALAHPEREIELLRLKIFAFWNDADSFDNYDVGFIKKNFPSLLNAPLMSFWLVSGLAIFAAVGGASRLKPNKQQDCSLLIICAALYMISVLLFYVTDRYRLPEIIFLFPFAGAAFPCAALLIAQKHWKILGAATSAALLFLGIALHAPLDTTDLSAFDWGTLTALYADKGEAQSSFDAFQKGITLSPTEIGSQAYIRAAEMHESLGQTEEAETLVKKAVELYPQDGVALYNLGRQQALHGDIDAALTTMNKAQELNPYYDLTYFALAKFYEKKGDFSHARQAAQAGLEINPADTRLLSLTESWQMQ